MYIYSIMIVIKLSYIIFFKTKTVQKEVLWLL